MFVPLPLHDTLDVPAMYTLFYNEFDRDFVFKGEAHDFWEFVYTDKGTAEVVDGANTLMLGNGCAVLHRPNVFHAVKSTGRVAPNVIVFTFACDSPFLYEHTESGGATTIYTLGREEKQTLQAILRHARTLFGEPFTEKSTQRLHLLPDADPRALQKVKNLIEYLLLSIIGGGAQAKDTPREHQSTHPIVQYIEQNLHREISVDELCTQFAIGKTKLSAIFRAETGYSPADYTSRLRIDRAKALIREKTLSFTEIAEQCGFSSIHYFSRRFKALTGLSPMQYLHSVQAE